MLNRQNLPTGIVCVYTIGTKCIETAASALTCLQTLCHRL